MKRALKVAARNSDDTVRIAVSASINVSSGQLTVYEADHLKRHLTDRIMEMLRAAPYLNAYLCNMKIG